ncbi:MAG TPA: ABC-2 family transporter protein [Kofleriaceae bacterium]|nr:ABC-2 family transporter protein [Kofleriaceae bacterium]
MRRYLTLLWTQLRVSAAQAMAYRANFVLSGVMAFAQIALTLIPLIVLFDRRHQVGDWTAPDMLVVVAYFVAIKAILEGVISPSMQDLVQRIRDGSFDYILLKPIDAQAMISASRYEPWSLFDLLGAIAIAVFAFIHRGHAPDALAIAAGLGLFVAGVIAMYSLWIAVAAAAFWIGRLDNLQYLLGAMFDTARWPVQVFPTVWRTVFTFLIPVAIMTTFPAMALLGRLDLRTAVATIAGALVMLVLSRLVWRAAIRNYTSASS